MVHFWPVVFVVFGPQGSGKSTQVERLAKRFDLQVFEAGVVLRERSIVDEKLHQFVNRGLLVADETMLGLVEEFIAENKTSKGYIFDGYPRNLNQFQGFKLLSSKYNWRIAGIFINLSDSSAKLRLSTRFQMINGKKVLREDDKSEVVQRRLDTFKRETLPLKVQFAQTYELLDIDGEPTVDEVTAEIDRAVNRFLYATN